ncbi:MAG: cupin domain-containing protein [Myxococcota bacterium]|nr:cupin domain-containing protein [Myxococcota bacterium]
MSQPPMRVVNAADAPEETHFSGDTGHHYRVLTPHNREDGSLGVSLNRLPPGKVAVPFHWHALEHEVFYILEGRGVFRYGDQLREVGPGDCLSCPAGTRTAHQLGNPFDQDLVYLGMGTHEPNEVCGYPDSDKLLVRHAQVVGRMEATPYMDGEPKTPRLLALWESLEP